MATFTGGYLLRRHLEQEAENRVRQDLNAASAFYRQRLEAVQAALRYTALGERFSQAVADRDLAYLVGRGFARYGVLASCVVAYDAREYSEDLYDRLIDGLLAEGVRVTAVGLTSTPHLHHILVQEGFDGGVMVTASHNPPRYHGFKVFGRGGDSIGYETGLPSTQ